MYAPPIVLPTLARVDAMIARIAVPRAQVAAVRMRTTGLRIQQAAHIRGEDLDTEAHTLVIRKGKSRREHALMRTVAVPTWLVPTLRELMALRDGMIIQHMDRYGQVYDERCSRRATSPSTSSGHGRSRRRMGRVAPGIWAPGNRVKASTTRALRAVYEAPLEEAGVRHGVIDWLVGHSGRSTRATSYTKPSMAQLRAAVEKVPPVAGLASGPA